MISNITTQSFTTSASSTSSSAPQAYFSTLDAAFVYIREYIEDNIGENISVCVKETILCINGKEKELYEVSFGTAQQYVLPQAPYTPYTPEVPSTAPLKDKWWESPVIYCGSVPKVTLNESTVGNAAQQTKAGCIMQSYEAGAGAAPQT